MLNTEVIGKIGKVKNFDDLTPKALADFSKAIIAVNEFQNNVSKYATHIFETKFIGTPEQWGKRLSKRDFAKLSEDDVESRSKFLFCYKRKKFFQHGFGIVGWIMGSYSSITTHCTINEKNILVVESEWETQEARFSHVPWISHSRTIEINYITGEILSLFGDNPLHTIR